METYTKAELLQAHIDYFQDYLDNPDTYYGLVNDLQAAATPIEELAANSVDFLLDLILKNRLVQGDGSKCGSVRYQ